MTPMIKQYLAVKNQHKDAIVLYRMGDFYEMFFDDAKKASKILDITLTSRDKSAKDPIAMCGFPAKAKDAYIKILLDNGQKVVICEQVEDPKLAKGLLSRKVIRVMSPGLVLDDNFLDEKFNNYIAALYQKKNKIGISYLDLSTLEFKAKQVDLDSFVDEIKKIDSKEIILPASLKDSFTHKTLCHDLQNLSVTFVNDENFSKELLEKENKKIKDQKDFETAFCAAAGLFFYVCRTQSQKADILAKKLELSHADSYLSVDALSHRNLEILSNLYKDKNSGLISIIDKTKTSMGGRLFKKWLSFPLLEKNKIQARLDAVEEAVNKAYERIEIREAFDSICDIERILSKLSMRHFSESIRVHDIISLKYAFEAMPKIYNELQKYSHYHFSFDNLFSGISFLETINNLAHKIKTTIKDNPNNNLNEGRVIREDYNQELFELVSLSRNARQELLKIETKEKQETKINNLKIGYNKIFGYYLEVSKAASKNLPPYFIRKQTLVNAERFITEELKVLEEKILDAKNMALDLEKKIFLELIDYILKHSDFLFLLSSYIAKVDCILNLAHIAVENSYVKPKIADDGSIQIIDGRHPVVEKTILQEEYIPNSIYMDNLEKQIFIITGPNMAGKSTILRMLALLVFMGHIGSFVPARKMVFSLCDKIFTRVGALDNLSAGESTFMVEMKEVAHILKNATPKSLVIIDEIGRGTSTFDGLSLAWAVAEYLHDFEGKGVKTLFATHYHELTKLSKTKEKVKNFNVSVKEINEEIIFLRKLEEGHTNKSYGIQVARLAGVPDSVVTRSKEVLDKIENKNFAFLKNKGNLHLLKPDSLNKKDKEIFAKLKDIKNKISNLDIMNLTPVNALNILNDFKKDLS